MVSQTVSASAEPQQQIQLSPIRAALWDCATALNHPAIAFQRGNGEVVQIQAGQPTWQQFILTNADRDVLIALNNITHLLVQAIPVPQATSALASLVLPDGQPLETRRLR